MGRHARDQEPPATPAAPERRTRPRPRDGAGDFGPIRLGTLTSARSGPATPLPRTPRRVEPPIAPGSAVVRRSRTAAASAMRRSGALGFLTSARVLTFLAFVLCVAAASWATAGRTYGAEPAPGPLQLPSVEPSTPPTPAEVATTPAPASTAALASTAAVGSTAATTLEPTADTPAGHLEADTSWADVVRGLEDQRSAAFSRSEPALLAAVYAAGSAPLEVDTAALADLTRRGLHAVGLHAEIDDVTVVTADLSRTSVRVVDRLPPYELRDAAGSVVSSEPGRAARTWLLDLVAAAGGWRIIGITAV